MQAYTALGLTVGKVVSIPKLPGFHCDRIVFLSIRRWDDGKTQQVSPDNNGNNLIFLTKTTVYV